MSPSSRIRRALILALPLIPVSLSAQHMETEAALRGLTLPPAYYEAISADPDAFTFPDKAWSNRALEAAANDDPLQGTLNVLVVLTLFADSPEP